MKKKGIAAGSIFLILIIVLIWGRINGSSNQSNNVKNGLASDNRMLQYDEISMGENIVEKDEMDRHYGCYEITYFYPTVHYSDVKYDFLPEQEADMMLGRTVIIEADLLVTYDSERALGTREGRNGFTGNYIIDEYTMENPQYECISISSNKLDFFLQPDDDMKSAIGKEFFDQIENVIMIPQLCSPYGNQYYYTLADEDKMIMYSTLSQQYFLLEKINENQEKRLPEQFSSMQKSMFLEEVYGVYEVIGFLPTKFYPALDSCGYEILPQEEANMMLGKEIVIREEMFNTYDNGRLPNSYVMNRLEDGFWIKKIEIENPEYQVKNVFREDIYGLRNDMLPDELIQQEYVEIDVFPGYETGGVKILPQLFLVENGQIIIYSMGEYFLLEKSS